MGPSSSLLTVTLAHRRKPLNLVLIACFIFISLQLISSPLMSYFYAFYSTSCLFYYELCSLVLLSIAFIFSTFHPQFFPLSCNLSAACWLPPEISDFLMTIPKEFPFLFNSGPREQIFLHVTHLSCLPFVIPSPSCSYHATSDAHTVI